jgi:hypothetical protein
LYSFKYPSNAPPTGFKLRKARTMSLKDVQILTTNSRCFGGEARWLVPVDTIARKTHAEHRRREGAVAAGVAMHLNSLTIRRAPTGQRFCAGHTSPSHLQLPTCELTAQIALNIEELQGSAWASGITTTP